MNVNSNGHQRTPPPAPQKNKTKKNSTKNVFTFLLDSNTAVRGNDVEGRGYGSANGEKGGSSSRERPSYDSGRGSRRRGKNFIII